MNCSFFLPTSVPGALLCWCLQNRDCVPCRISLQTTKGNTTNPQLPLNVYLYVYVNIMHNVHECRWMTSLWSHYCMYTNYESGCSVYVNTLCTFLVSFFQQCKFSVNHNCHKFAFSFLFHISYFIFRALQITFKTRIYHPNVDEKGQVCLPIISPENWKPATKTDQGQLGGCLLELHSK